AALHGRKRPAASKRLHGIDAPSPNACRERETGEGGLVIDQHRAGTAFPPITAGLGAGEAYGFAQIVKEEPIVGHRVDASAPVERELEHACHNIPSRRLPPAAPGREEKVAAAAFACQGSIREGLFLPSSPYSKLDGVTNQFPLQRRQFGSPFQNVSTQGRSSTSRLQALPGCLSTAM